MVVQFIVFLTLSPLICRGMDILKGFSESLKFEITKVDCMYFLFLHQNICCRYSLEAPHSDTPNEYHNICFSGEIRKILCGYPFLSGAMMDPYKFDSNSVSRTLEVFVRKELIFW